MEHANFEDLKGKTLTAVTRLMNAELAFHTADGAVYRMYHAQDCCESVTIEDICGDMEDVLGSPILVAERAEQEGKGRGDDYCTWTFYKLDTCKGGVTIRWYGESNGYYSERVDFVRVE